METKKIFTLILVSILLGACLGFGISYVVLHSEILEIDAYIRDEVGPMEMSIDSLSYTIWNYNTTTQERLNNLSSDLADLNSTINEMNNRTWHVAQALEGTGDAIGSAFKIMGNSMRVGWTMSGYYPNSTMAIYIRFENGTTYTYMGSSGVLFSGTSEIQITPAKYYIEIITHEIDNYRITIWDYY